MKASERNALAKQFILDKLEFASSQNEADFKNLPEYLKLKAILQDLICVSAKGFRGVVATAITGKYLNPDYDPLNNFYSCKPRSIFEQGIYYAFEGRVPCGKSDPLNVAKNTNVLNDEWAKGSRPQSAAQAAVDYLRCIESVEGETREKVINFFFFKLLEYSNSILAIKINTPLVKRLSNQAVASKLAKLIIEYPESGAIPQLVVSKLLNELYANSNVTVEGGNESVFGTNTTSKKPADIWLSIDGRTFNLFEITVKKIDYKKLDDCIQSLKALDMLGQPVTFICRLPADVSTLHDICNNSITYKDKAFDFLDILDFINSVTSLLRIDQINNLIGELQSFVSDVNRSKKTKDGWNKIFS